MPIKFSISFSNNVKEEDKEAVKEILGVQTIESGSNYLGLRTLDGGYYKEKGSVCWISYTKRLLTKTNS